MPALKPLFDKIFDLVSRPARRSENESTQIDKTVMGIQLPSRSFVIEHRNTQTTPWLHGHGRKKSTGLSMSVPEITAQILNRISLQSKAMIVVCILFHPFP